MQENQITIKNLQVNYKISGQGKPLLVLHGWPSSSERWLKVAELLPNLQLVIPDLPGFGKSETPKTSWTLSDYVEWLREFTQQVPELRNDFLLLGHSFGGALAAKFSIKYNQSVQKLVLVSAACVRQPSAKKRLAYHAAKFMKIFAFMPGYVKVRKGLYKYLLRSDYPQTEGVMQQTYLQVIMDDLSQKIGFIRVPTVIIWGTKDALTPLEQGQWLAQKIPHAKLLLIENGDHALQINFPEQLVQHIIKNI